MAPKLTQFSAVLFHFFITVLNVYLATAIHLIIFYCLYTGGFFRYAVIVYFIFFYIDWNSRDTGWDQPQINTDNIADYFHGKIIKTCEIPSGRNYIIGVHPHGFACFGGFFLRSRKLYDEIFGQRRLWIGANSLMFAMPFIREYGLMLGFISCTFKNLFVKLTKNNDIILVLFPGGILEGIYSGVYPGENRLVLKQRRGFCKLALMTGSALLPAFSFGENEVFRTLEIGGIFKNVQKFLYRCFGFPVYNIASFPRRVPVTLVLGKPIFVDKIENPTQDEIDELHRRYINALRDVYDSYKEKYLQNPNVPLVIE